MTKISESFSIKQILDIRHTFIPSKVLMQNSEHHQQTRLLTTVLNTLTLSIILLFIPLSLLTNPPSLENPEVYIMIGILTTFAIAHRLNQNGYYKQAAFLTVLSATIGLLSVITANLSQTMSYQEIINRTNMLVFLVIPVLLTNMLLSIPATGVVVFISILGMIALASTLPQVTFIMLASGPLSYFLVVATLSLLATSHHNKLAFERQTQLTESEKKHRILAESLRQRERLLNATQRLTHIGGWEWNKEPPKVFWTDETYYIHGFDPHEIPNGAEEHIKRSAECYAPEDRPVILAAFERCTQEGINYDLEFQITTAQEELKWIRTTAQAQKEDGKIIKVIGTFMDITDRKLAAEAMRESQERLDTAVESAGIGLWNWYIQTGETIFNERWAEIIGYTLEELQPVSIETWRTFIHPDDLEKSRSLLRKHFAGELDYYECEVRMRHKSGSWMWILSRGRVVEWDNDGDPIRMAGAHTDITQRKQAEAALRASEMQYRTLIEQSEDAIYLLYNNKFQVINPKFTTLFGITQEEAYAPDFDFQNLVAPQSQARVEKWRQRLTTGKELSPRYEFMALDKNGNEIAVEVSVSYIPYRDGKATQGILRDITKRKLRETINAARWHLLQFSATHSLDDLLEETLAEVEKLTNSTISFYHFVEEGKHSVKLQRWSARTKTKYCQIEGKGMQYSIDQAGVWADSIRQRKPIIHNNYAKLSNRRGLPQGHAPLIREIVVPVLRGDKIIAVLGVGNKPSDYTHMDVETTSQLADIAWEIIDRKRAEEARERRVTQLVILNDIGGKIAAVLELDVLMERIVSLVQESFNYHHVALFTIKDDESTLVLRAKAGNTENLYPEIQQLAVGKGIVGWVAKHGKTRLVNNIKLDPDYFKPQQDKRIPSSKLSVPIQAGKVVVGVLDIQSPQSNAFDKDDVLVMETLADQIAVALMNAQLYEKLTAERRSLAQRVAERTTDLSRANAELARAARLKDEFLANMSHELRTPLNAILSLSEMLQEGIQGPVTEHQTRALSRIEESGRHLLSLINDILDLSKIGAGKMDLQIAPVIVEDLCQASLRMIKQLAHKKRLKVVSTLDNTVTILQADERRLKQILVNLLNNAVKFTPEGGRIGLEVTGDTELEVAHFTVWDTGIGIPQEDMKQLFQPFVQLDSSLSRQYAGTGLGLSLVARMTELHGGSVSVVSEVGKGSRFTISLPWTKLPTPAFKPGNEGLTTSVTFNQTPDSNGQKFPIIQPHILLTEDNEANIETLTDYLTKKGYRLTIARNGYEALERIAERPPDLILMDIQMPEMNGLMAIQHIRADNNPDIAEIPIIAITALAMTGDRERCLEAGANEYLSKPISLKILVKVIKEQLHGVTVKG